VGGVFPSGLLIGTVKDFKVRELDAQARLIPAVLPTARPVRRRPAVPA